ncbi:MAG: peptidylprolyl isomerase [Candidatus Sericytochromatia bacterium]
MKNKFLKISMGLLIAFGAINVSNINANAETKKAPVATKKAEKNAPFVFDKTKEYKVLIETTMGKIKLKTYTKESPKSVENFVTLISRKYYDGIIFHRVIKDFMIQTGDPTGTGRGGSSAWNKEFENENSPKLAYNKEGIVGMANHGRDTNGSQFFITTGARPHLNGGYTIFAEVIEGMDVVKAIENVKTSAGDRPEKEVKMLKVTLVK